MSCTHHPKCRHEGGDYLCNWEERDRKIKAGEHPYGPAWAHIEGDAARTIAALLLQLVGEDKAVTIDPARLRRDHVLQQTKTPDGQNLVSGHAPLTRGTGVERAGCTLARRC